MLGLMAKKIGMTRIYDAVGEIIPVTVVQVIPGVVTQKKTVDSDGYKALQLGFGEIKADKVNKPSKGHFDKNGLKPKRHLKEFRVENVDEYEVGQEITTAEIFKTNAYVDITGTSKGKGYAGVIKKHNFSRGPESHGSRHHREPGSVGATGPFRVFKGKKLPGRMGNKTKTIQNLKVIKVDVKEGLLFVKGSVPGNRTSNLVVKPALKKKSL